MEGFIFGLPQDPAQMEALREAKARAEMSVEAFRHGVIALIDSLDQENLSVLQRMLHVGMHDAQQDTPENVMAMWDGMIRTTAAIKFNICQSCLIDHSQDFTDFLKSQTPVTDAEPSSGMRADLAKEEEESGVRTSDFTEAERETANQYHVDDIRIEGTNELIGVICTGINGRKEGCGTRWPSLEDRTLREPENCSGCHIRSAHG